MPVAFLGGLAGQLYQQFAVTVAIAVTISGVSRADADPGPVRDSAQTRPQGTRICSDPFNRGFAWITDVYIKAPCAWRSATSGSALIAFVLVIAASAAAAHAIIPGSLVPVGGFGLLLRRDACCPTAPRSGAPARSAPRSQHTMAEYPAVEHVFVVNGFDLIGGGNKTNAAHHVHHAQALGPAQARAPRTW